MLAVAGALASQAGKVVLTSDPAGSVITGAAVVLAGTFSILALIPFVALALVWDAGPRVWRPSALRR